MASYAWGAPSNNDLSESQKKVPLPKATSDGYVDFVSYYKKLQEDAELNSLRSMSDDDLLKAYEQAKAREASLSEMSDEELLKAYEDAKTREASSAPAPEAQPPMGAFEYLRKSAEAKGVEFKGPEWKKNLDATLIALAPFSGKVLRMGSGIPDYLVKTAKGDFDINDRLIRETYHQEFIPYYAGVASIEDVKKSIQEKAKLQALNYGSKERAIAQEISERGTGFMGTVFGKGAEIVGQAGEMLVPGGLATKFAVGAGTEAAARYAEHANAKIGYDENGNPVVLDGDSAGKAAKEALIGGGVQSGIELLGGKVLGKAWGATGGKLLGKAAETAVGQKVAENSIVKGVGKITNWLKTPLEITGWSGMPGEIGEEFMQGAIDAYFGLNTTDAEERGTTAGGRFKEFAGDFFKGENLADLAGSMLLMQAIGGSSAYLQKRHTNKQLNKIITEKIGGVSENVLNKLSPEEKARIIESHYQGLSAEEAADIINKGAGALDKFMIEKQTEATKSADGRAMLAETNPEAADAIRAARREGKDISRKMIRDLGLSEKVLGDVESRNKFGDALLEDGRARAAKNLSKMDSQQKMALGETIAHFVDVNDKDIKKKVYDQIASEITDASVLDDPYQREQLVMKAVDAVYQKEGLGIKVPDISTKEVVNETRTDETQQKPDEAQPVTPPAGEAARPVEAGKATPEVGGEVAELSKKRKELQSQYDANLDENGNPEDSETAHKLEKELDAVDKRLGEIEVANPGTLPPNLKAVARMPKSDSKPNTAPLPTPPSSAPKTKAQEIEEQINAGRKKRDDDVIAENEALAKSNPSKRTFRDKDDLRANGQIGDRVVTSKGAVLEVVGKTSNGTNRIRTIRSKDWTIDYGRTWNKGVQNGATMPAKEVVDGNELNNSNEALNVIAWDEGDLKDELNVAIEKYNEGDSNALDDFFWEAELLGEGDVVWHLRKKSAVEAHTSAPTKTQANTPPTTAESAEGGSRASSEVFTPTKPKTVKEGKAFVKSNIGKQFTDGKKTYEITGLTKDGEVSVKVTDKIGKSSETTLKLSGTLTNIFGTKKRSAVWSEVKAAGSVKNSPNRTKTTADDVARLADETVPTYLKAMESSHNGGNIGEDYKIESNFANEVLKMVKGMSESELGEVSASLRKALYAKGNPMPGGYKPLLDAASYALDAARAGKDSVRLPMPEHLRTRVKTAAKTPKTEQKVPKTEVADKKTAREAEKAEVKRNESGSKAEVKKPKSETAPSITPAEAMKKLGTLGAADVDTLTKAMHREERLGHTERANIIRVLRDYKRGVGTNPNPQSDETSGGKYRASVEAAKPLDDPAFVAWAKKRGVAPTTQKRDEYDKAMADTLKNCLSRWIKGVSVTWVNFIAPEEGGDLRAAKKRSRAGTVNQVVPENERAVFRQEFMRLKSDYEHSNDGNTPLSGGLFTSDAYYLYDIIGDNPVAIERIPINDTNREKIAGLDKKYKAEIYKGTRNSAYWADRFRNELSGHLSSGNGVDNGEGSLDFGDMDSGRIRQERQSISDSRGDSSSSEDDVSPIRLLHDGERIVGSYNRATGEVKLAKGASVETVLHELGWHAARHWAEVNADSDPKAKALLEQMKKYAESAPKEIKDAVRDVYGDLDADTLLDEIGAHRFVKDQSGKIAEALATKEGAAWYQKVWNKVVDFFKNFLTKIGYNRVNLDGIENMSPEVFGDFLADVMMSGKQLGERTAFSMEAPKGLVAKWTNNLSDYKAPIAELEKRVMTSSNKIYYLARTLEGQAQRGKNRAERAIKRVEKILGKDISPELLAQYMQLKAYEERNAKIERRNGKADASGMTPEDARAIEKTINESGVDEAIFEEAAQILWDLQKEGLQARVDAGLLDQETANKWMTDEPHHIPWKDAVDPDSGEYVGRKLGASEFDTAEGRKTAASGDPITWMLQEYQDAMTRAAQNRLRSSIANLTRLNGDVGTIYDGIQTDSKGKRSFIKYPKGGGKAKVLSIPEGVKIESTVKNDGGMKNVLTFKESGETKYLVLNGTLGEAVAGAVTGRTLARPIPYLGAINRFSSATATTFSWAFAAKNYKRDTVDVRNNFIADFGWKKGNMLVASAEKFAWTHIKELSRYAATGELSLDEKGNPTTEFAKLVLEYEDAGGLMSGNAVQSYDHIEKQIKADFRFGKNRVRSLVKGAADLYMAVPKISELLTRIGAFAALRKDGMSAKDAAMWARESTFDFDKKGAFAPVLNSLWLFSNANIQAAHRQLRGLIKSKNGWKVAADMAVVGFVMHIVNEMLNADDDDEDEKEGLGIDKDISEYDRQHYIFLRFGQKMYRTPVNLGPYGFARYIGDVTARMMTGDISIGEAAKNLGVSAAEIGASSSGVPINMGAVIQTGFPSLTQGIVQGLSGKNFAGFDLYKNKHPQNKTPDSHYGKRTTAPAYKWVAEKLNEITGGNEAKPGWIDIRPETVELVVENIGKSALRDITDLSRIPKAFIVDDKDIDGNESRYWDAKAVYDQDKHELKNRSDLKGDERRAYLKEHPWLYSAGKPGVTRIDNIVKRIEKLRDIEESDRATEERKAEAKAMRFKLQARVIKIMEGKYP